MSSLRIAEVAQRSGVPATTLRYYEQIGLLSARRSDNGYRSYDERDVERLAFITRAKQLDISLEDLAELVEVWDSEDCSQVAHRMAGAVAARHRETQTKIQDLGHLADQLQQAADRLTSTSASGRCGPGCACLSPAQPATATATADNLAEPPVACSLPGVAAVSQRLAEWQDALAAATSRAAIAGGLTLRFDLEHAGTVARLAAAEHDCCPFFTFALHLRGGSLDLEVTAPAHAAALLEELFGNPDPALRALELLPVAAAPDASAGQLCDCC